MSPLWMSVLLVVSFAGFGYTLWQRWQLMTLGGPANRFDRPVERFTRMVRYGFAQARMPRHKIAGFAHILVFFGAVITPIRALVLIARGYTSDQLFGFGIFNLGTPLGDAYNLIKDIFVILVLLGVAIFFYYRVIKRLPRMTLNFEGLAILAILSGLMLADALYDGATLARLGGHVTMWEPVGALVAAPLRGSSEGTLTVLQHIGFWGHVGLIFFFMNYLPYTKQFHEVTGIPNVFFQNLRSPGYLEPLEDLEGKAEREETLGVARAEQYSWKAILDFYSCTECGRCSDKCPATETGKALSPKHLTVDLRDHLYSRQSELIRAAKGNGEAAEIAAVPDVIKPEVLWACTTCGACQQECPVFISYIDKIVDLRRHLAMERGEFPEQLQNLFQGLETVGNPYSFPNDQRAEWAEGLDVPLRWRTSADVEYGSIWVGCAASFDDRSRKIARAFAQLLLKTAGVELRHPWSRGNLQRRPPLAGPATSIFSRCWLSRTSRRSTVTTSRRSWRPCARTATTRSSMSIRTSTASYEVIHHSELLAQLLRDGRLKPRAPSEGTTITYHDACYLGRHNDIYDPPRDVLQEPCPGVQVDRARRDAAATAPCAAAPAEPRCGRKKRRATPASTTPAPTSCSKCCRAARRIRRSPPRARSA